MNQKRKETMRKSISAIVCSALILAACATSPLEELSLTDRATAKMLELSQAGELSTTEYTISKIVKANDCEWYTVGDRKILFNCKAHLEAGIDMRDYDATRTVIDEEAKSITIVLPKAKLLSMNMPYNETRIAYEKVGAIRASFSAKDRNDLLRQGEKDIRAGLEGYGILEDAERNAQTFFTAMLSQMGFKQINIKFD